jgi:hypothetical protein
MLQRSKVEVTGKSNELETGEVRLYAPLQVPCRLLITRVSSSHRTPSVVAWLSIRRPVGIACFIFTLPIVASHWPHSMGLSPLADLYLKPLILGTLIRQLAHSPHLQHYVNLIS